MERLGDDLLARVVGPLASTLFGDEVFARSLDHHHLFAVRYAVGEDETLAMHHDASEVTLNVCLGTAGFEGGALQFCGRVGDGDHRAASGAFDHRVGTARVVCPAGRGVGPCSTRAPRRRRRCAMDEVDHIIAEILTERKHSASKTSLLLETKKLREAWDALNAWILDRVIQRRGAAVPNFGKFTWQVLGGFTPADLDPRLAGKKAASKIPLRPVFMFAENFCRSHGLPWRRQNEADLVKCGDLDYSNLALRYSSHLTKDMVFAALRDVTRRVGEKIASGFALRVKMSVGSLVCEHGKCRFEFDAASLAPRAEPARGAAAADAPAAGAAAGTVAASRPASEDKSDDAGDGGDEPCRSVLAKTNGEIMRDSTDALLGMLPTKNHLKPSATYYRRDRDPGKPLLSELNDKCKTTGLLQAESSVADAAYERHLASIEHEANRIQDEKVEYLQNQIDTKAVKHAREKEIPEDELKEQEALGAIVTKSLEASKGKTSRPADGAPLRRNASVAESLKQPMRPMLEGPFKMYNITGFPTRGRAENIKVHELCDELAPRVRAAAVAVPKHPKTNSVGLLRRVRGSSATARAVFIPAFAVAVVAFQSFTYLCQTPDVLGIIFSVFASNTFTGLYEQQELAHVAVYAEVSVARALLEQLVLVLGGPREPRCRAALAAYGRYLADLRLDRALNLTSNQVLRVDGALLASTIPAQYPLMEPVVGYGWSRDTNVENVYVNNSDDGVCMKSGLDGFGINLAIPTEDVLVRNITCDDAGRGGFAVGSEMSGGVRNVTFRDSVLGAGPQSRASTSRRASAAAATSSTSRSRTSAPSPFPKANVNVHSALRDDPDVPGDDLVPVIGNLRFANVSGPSGCGFSFCDKANGSACYNLVVEGDRPDGCVAPDPGRRCRP
ncbi:DUF4496-containing protein [Aureococcus anophagefferens]|nr:DUF4496-containing protein [Aureococcus anophagefferens]